MKKNDNSPDIGRLCDAISKARLSYRYTRQVITDMVRQFVGKNYSENGSEKQVPCNLLGLYVDIVGPKLIANNPAVMLSTDNHDAEPVADMMEDWANKEIGKINLAETEQRCVLNALFAIGVVKVGLATAADAAVTGWNLDAGDPFAENIDFDDFVFDIHARSFDQCSFMGHRYRAPLSVVKKSGIYLGKRGDIQADDDDFFNQEGDERLSMIGRGYYSNKDEFEDMVDLWEIYLPRHGLIVTLLDDNISGPSSNPGDKWYGKALRVQRWLGPDSGPYHILGFGVVPGNIMPKAPLQDLYDLHMHINVLVRKLMWQAENQKEILPVRSGADADGQRIQDASDGQIVRCDNEPPKPVKFNGADQNTYQIFEAFKALYAWLAGNLDALGGLSPQAKTLGQDRLLGESASAGIAAMQDRTIKHASSVIEALCWFWYNHPQKVMRSKFAPEGAPPGISIMREMHPPGKSLSPQGQPQMSRSIPFEDLEIQVDPYSMPKSTPQQKFAALSQIVTTIIIPMSQQLQAAGTAFDSAAWLEMTAKLLNLPELKKLLTLQEPPNPDQEQATGGGEPPGAPKGPETTRNYVRHSQAGATAEGAGQERADAMKAASTPEAA